MVMGCVAVISAAGCGSHKPPLSPACTESPQAVQAALETVPGNVTLPDGTPLSHCISAATDDADLQNVGSVFFVAAESLAEKARAGDNKAAEQLGYLIGATRRGAAKTNGVMAELQRRIELVGGRVQERVPAQRAALDSGRIEGQAKG